MDGLPVLSLTLHHKTTGAQIAMIIWTVETAIATETETENAMLHSAATDQILALQLAPTFNSQLLKMQRLLS